MEEAPKQDGAGAATPAKAELPTVESPSISPATKVQAAFEFEPVSEPVVAAPAVEPVTLEAAPATPPRFVLRPRHKRYALLAASVTLAAALFHYAELPKCERMVAVLSGGNIEPELKQRLQADGGATASAQA